MTTNNLTDERLSVLIRVARDSLELYEMELPVIDDVMLALAELQQRRAAMLQGSQPVSNRDELPLDYLQGHKDGLEWAAQLAEANHPQTGDWLYDDPVELAKAIRKGPDMPPVEPGNSPVIPDCWVACSERMPASQEWVIVFAKWANQQVLCWDDVANRWTDFEDQSYFHDMFSHWMPLPAAPQQEAE